MYEESDVGDELRDEKSIVWAVISVNISSNEPPNIAKML
jgi:hypothetical protein